MSLSNPITCSGSVLDVSAQMDKREGIFQRTTFTLKETKAGKGYDKSDDGIVVVLVVFETVYDAFGNLVGEHQDFTDTSQTVTVGKKPAVPPITPPKTGVYLFVILLGLLAASGTGLMISRRRAVRLKKEEDQRNGRL